MNLYIYKLDFTTPVRFGADGFSADLSRSAMTCHADTLFSAIYVTWRKIYGEDKAKLLVQAAQQGELSLSDLLPYKQTELYLPKPKLILERETNTHNENSLNKKVLKKLRYIPTKKFSAYIDFIKTGKELTFDLAEDFAQEILQTRAAIYDHSSDTLPYKVSSHKFKPDCGLYFIVQIEKELKDLFDNALNCLASEGIGGKRSSGLGKFKYTPYDLEMPPNFKKKFTDPSEYYMSLSAIAPCADDLAAIDTDRTFYKLIKRSGFVYSDNYTDGNSFVKKQDTFMFDAGSCFHTKITGSLQNIQNMKSGNHPVYRYGKAMLMGVPL